MSSYRHQGRRPPPRQPQGAPPVSAGLSYPVPADTLRAWNAMRARQQKCRNIGLLFDRYIGYLADWRLDDKRAPHKKDELQRLVSGEFEDDLRKNYVERWKQSLGEYHRMLEGHPQWRFLTGLGAKGPLEIGFTFHSLYGFPIIPASGLKGLTQAYALLSPDIPEFKGLSREQREAHPLFIAVFGEQRKREDKRQGLVIFHDGIPTSTPKLELDVMNPHYPQYYQGDEPPANWQSPQPVFFLTLNKDSRFLFAVSAKNFGKPAKDSDAQAAYQLAAKWLQAALQEMGAGAKTSAGYGFWNVDIKKE